MSFNTGPNKQVQEVILSHKIKKLLLSCLAFNINNVLQASSQKHLGVTLDFMLVFHEQLNEILNKVDKTIDLLRNNSNEGQH